MLSTRSTSRWSRVSSKRAPNEAIYKTRLTEFKEAREEVKGKLRDLQDPDSQLRQKENRASQLKAVMAKATKAIAAASVVLEEHEQGVADTLVLLDEEQTKLEQATVSLAQIRSEQRILVDVATGTKQATPADIVSMLPKEEERWKTIFQNPLLPVDLKNCESEVHGVFTKMAELVEKLASVQT